MFTEYNQINMTPNPRYKVSYSIGEVNPRYFRTYLEVLIII